MKVGIQPKSCLPVSHGKVKRPEICTRYTYSTDFTKCILASLSFEKNTHSFNRPSIFLNNFAHYELCPIKLVTESPPRTNFRSFAKERLSFETHWRDVCSERKALFWNSFTRRVLRFAKNKKSRTLTPTAMLLPVLEKWTVSRITFLPWLSPWLPDGVQLSPSHRLAFAASYLPPKNIFNGAFSVRRCDQILGNRRMSLNISH